MVENTIPLKRNPLEGIIWGLWKAKVRLRANTMGWRQAHSDLIWIQGCTSDRQRSNVERAEGLIRKKCFFLFLTKHLLTASVSLTYMSQKNVFPNLEKLFEKKTLCSSYDSAGRRLEVIVQIRSAGIIRQSSLSKWGSFWLPRLWHWPRWVMLLKHIFLFRQISFIQIQFKAAPHSEDRQKWRPAQGRDLSKFKPKLPEV